MSWLVFRETVQQERERTIEGLIEESTRQYEQEGGVLDLVSVDYLKHVTRVTLFATSDEDEDDPPYIRLKRVVEERYAAEVELLVKKQDVTIVVHVPFTRSTPCVSFRGRTFFWWLLLLYSCCTLSIFVLRLISAGPVAVQVDHSGEFNQAGLPLVEEVVPLDSINRLH